MALGQIGNPKASRTRVLFLCWGYSIHAQRRIQIFVDDPQFDVCVVSTYDYGFEGARNISLGSSEISFRGPQPVAKTRRLAEWFPVGLREYLIALLRLAWMPFEITRSYRDWKILKSTVRELEPDIIFLQTLQYPSFLAYLLSKDLPIIITFWNGDVTHYAKWTGIEMLIKKKLVVYGIRRATAITVNSHAAFSKCLEHGAMSEKIHLIRYPGADLARFQPGSRDDARRRLVIEKSHVVLCPRGLGQFFNSEVIVQAARRVVGVVPDVLFLFISGVGGKSEWERHMKYAKELGIAGNLRWDGHVPWEEMPIYYHCANVMVSILEKDSMSNCMIEAMACGVPVVLSDTPQSREWVQDGQNGLLCNPHDADECADKILTVLKDSGDLRRQFAAFNLEKVSREANSMVNSERIKQLVKDLVHRKELVRSEEGAIICGGVYEK